MRTEGETFQPWPSSRAAFLPVPSVAMPALPFSPVKFSGLIERVWASDKRERLPRVMSRPLNGLGRRLLGVPGDGPQEDAHSSPHACLSPHRSLPALRLVLRDQDSGCRAGVNSSRSSPFGGLRTVVRRAGVNQAAGCRLRRFCDGLTPLRAVRFLSKKWHNRGNFFSSSLHSAHFHPQRFSKLPSGRHWVCWSVGHGIQFSGSKGDVLLTLGVRDRASRGA